MNMTLVILIICALIAIALIVVFVVFGRGEGRFTIDIGGAAPRAEGGADNSADTGFHTRLTGLGAVAGSVIGILLARLWSMQLISSDDYTEQAESNRTRTVSTMAPRGRILDRNGVELVTNRSSLTVTATADVADDTVECQLLANLIGMPALAVRRKIRDMSEGAQSMRTVASDVSRHAVAFIEERSYLFHDIEVEQRSVRLYPNGSLAAHVLGYAGTITSEQLEQANANTDPNALAYQSGDTVGQTGVEARYESVLQGVRGEQTVYVDSNGNVIDYVTSVDPQAGSDIMLTIDAAVQRAAEESLATTIAALREKGAVECTSGSVVCLDVTNGEVICMASEPTYSPNVFVGGISSADWELIAAEEADNPLLNRAISGQYPSASTIKPLTTLTALDNGFFTKKSEFECSGYWTGFGDQYGQYCWNHEGHGMVTLETGIIYSCDVVFYEIGKAVFMSDKPEALQEKYREWGLGASTGIDLPSEAIGRVPDADWKWNYYTWADDIARSWQGGDDTNLAIGQGDLLVTPLQMACVYSAIAMRGSCFTPHVLKSVLTSGGTGSVIEYAPVELRHMEEDEKHYDLLHSALEGVVYEEDAAQASHFTNMKERVAGKTGTAESSHSDPHGWFVGYVPADNPKYVVASCLEYAGFGSVSAMYVVRDVMGALYGEPDTSTQESGGDR
jgi:penicillin-binding protein 2